MQNRSQITKEFFELIVYLNKGNSKANTKTELAFDIRDSHKCLDFGCYLKGNDRFLILCRKPELSPWRQSNFTQFTYIEDYCQQLLNLNKKETNNVILVQLVSNQLRNLGILKK